MTEDRSRHQVRHETSDVNVRGILVFGVALIVTALLTHVVVFLLWQVLAHREAARTTPLYPLAQGAGERLPPEPRLQATPQQDLKDLRAGEDATLHGYGWVDRSAGIARIPIDRAM